MRPKFAEFLVDAHVQKILKRRSNVLDHSLVKVEVALGGSLKKEASLSVPLCLNQISEREKIFVG